MDIHKIDWSAMEWKEIRKGVEQKAFSGSAATSLCRLMPGHEPKPHSHPHEQMPISSPARCAFTSATRFTTSDLAGSLSFRRTSRIGAKSSATSR